MSYKTKHISFFLFSGWDHVYFFPLSLEKKHYLQSFLLNIFPQCDIFQNGPPYTSSIMCQKQMSSLFRDGASNLGYKHNFIKASTSVQCKSLLQSSLKATMTVSTIKLSLTVQYSAQTRISIFEELYSNYDLR